MKIPSGLTTRGKTIARGAESEIYVAQFFNYDVIVKHRYKKTYRANGIDDLLRKERTTQEIRLLIAANKLGVNVPHVLDLDKNEWKLTMEKIKGEPIKNNMDASDDKIIKYYKTIGKFMGILHQNDIIHGDLTTSNILIDEIEKIWFIDFGLGYVSTQIEDKAVDLIVLKHTLRSSHNKIWKLAFNTFIDEYCSVYKNHNKILSRMKKVEDRIRYSH